MPDIVIKRDDRTLKIATIGVDRGGSGVLTTGPGEVIL